MTPSAGHFLFPVPLVRLRKSGGRAGPEVEAAGKMLRKLLALQSIPQRTIITASRRQIQNRVPENQKRFQEDNGLPVYLKGGLRDMILYRLTMTLSVVGTGYLLYELFMASMPKKQQ